MKCWNELRSGITSIQYPNGTRLKDSVSFQQRCHDTHYAVVQQKLHSGKPSTSSNDESINQLLIFVMKNCPVTNSELSNQVGIKTDLLYLNLSKDLSLQSEQKMCAKAANNGAETTPSESFTGHTNGDSDFLNTVITGDES